jgi:hypothetical protein
MNYVGMRSQACILTMICKQFPFEATTTFFSLWAGMCSQPQAKKISGNSLTTSLLKRAGRKYKSGSIAGIPEDVPNDNGIILLVGRLIKCCYGKVWWYGYFDKSSGSDLIDGCG